LEYINLPFSQFTVIVLQRNHWSTHLRTMLLFLLLESKRSVEQFNCRTLAMIDCALFET